MTLFARPRLRETGPSCAKSFFSSASSKPRATDPRPIPAWYRRSRRLSGAQASFDIDKFIRIEEGMAERREVEPLRGLELRRRRRTPQGDLEGPLDAAGLLREGLGPAMDERTIEQV